MSSFADFTDFQIVFTNENINNYDPRPKISFSQFTDFQPVFTSKNIVKNYEIKQHESYKFFLMYESAPGIIQSCNKLNINPNNNVEIQTLLDTYSGTVGKTTFTGQELYNLALNSSGNIKLVFAETVIPDVPVAQYESWLAKITTSTGKIIWSYQIVG